MSIFKTHLFAVTREDHQVEDQVISNYPVKRFLTICSGGCVPLSIKALHPKLDVLLFDINPYQINHVKNKAQLINSSKLAQLNIGQLNDNCLNQSGSFEHMFQKLRNSFIHNVSNETEINTFFNPSITDDERVLIVKRWENHKNINVPFKEVFNDRSIEEVFSDQATKHGKPGSYIEYFQNKLLEGFLKKSAHLNPFLQHIFLGYYKSTDPFPYIKLNNLSNFSYFNGSITEIKDIHSYDFISLSNIFDWSDIDFVEQCADHLSNIKTGSLLLIRQLNNHQNWIDTFGSNFIEQEKFDIYWQQHDRSMFYDHFRLFIRK